MTAVTSALLDGRSWVRRTLPDWRWPLPGALLAALEAEADYLTRSDRPLTTWDWRPGSRAAAAEHLGDLPARLERGAGFAVVDRLPAAAGDPQRSTALYWLLGRLVGEPLIQNVQGTLLYDVRDTGLDLYSGARVSVTNLESGFHTDNSFGDRVLDYVGLLCLQPARSGGLNQMVSGYSLHARLVARCPDALRLLESDFLVERRGGLRPGETPVLPVPVFAWDAEELLVRYLRYWIESGHRLAGSPLREEQIAALDALDTEAAEPSLRGELMLEPGQVLLANNRWLLHNRTAFEDFPEPERKRWLLRLWLTRPGTAGVKEDARNG